jgi:hypothetical protein
MSNEDYPNIPERTIASIQRYVNDHIETGGFLYAVLTNDLMESFARADGENQRAMFEIVKYIYNEIPKICHGSKEIVDEWLSKRGGSNG